MARIILFILLLQISLFARIINYKFLSEYKLFVYTENNNTISIKRDNTVDVFNGSMVLIDLDNFNSVKIEAMEGNKTLDTLDLEVGTI